MDITQEAISYGHGDLGRIYERLRKRSARSHRRNGSGDFYFGGEHVNEAPYWVGFDSSIDVWEAADHGAYVAGVKAALAAVQAIA